MKHPLLVLLSSLILGCTREQVIENISFPQAENKVAVYCLLTPGDSIFASLKTLKSISALTQDSTESVTTAQIILQNSQTKKQAVLRYLGHDGLYGCSQQELPVVTGHQYTLVTYIPSINTPLQASCTVPGRAANIETFTYGLPYHDGAYERRRYSLSWRDVSDRSITYNYAIVFHYAFPVTDGGGSRIITGESLYINEGFEKATDYVYYAGDCPDTHLTQTVHLLTMDSNLFRFYALADNMYKGVRRGGTNDFFGAYQGVMPEFTNIENGFGVFGAYLRTEKDIIIQ